MLRQFLGWNDNLHPYIPTDSHYSFKERNFQTSICYPIIRFWRLRDLVALIRPYISSSVVRPLEVVRFSLVRLCLCTLQLQKPALIVQVRAHFVFTGCLTNWRNSKVLEFKTNQYCLRSALVGFALIIINKIERYIRSDTRYATIEII